MQAIITPVPDTADLLARFTKYHHLIESLMRSSLRSPSLDAESATAIQVERGSIIAGGDAALVERLIEVAKSERLSTMAVIDSAGHLRPVYRPLLVYAWLCAFRAQYE